MRVTEPMSINLGETIHPVVLVDALEVGSAKDYPKSCWGRTAPPGGGPGLESTGTISGPVDMGIVVVVTDVYINVTTAGLVDFYIGNGLAIGTPGNRSFADVRDTGTPNAITHWATPAGRFGAVCGVFEVLAGEQIHIPVNFILGDDDFLSIVNETADDPMDVTYRWTEYLATDR